MDKNNNTPEDKVKQSEMLKDSLENLCLYLNEIERIINLEKTPETEHEHKYKLQVLEQYISEMNDVFKLIASEGRGNNIIVS